jgi:hypothetical protein
VRLKLDVVVCCYLKDNGLLFCNVDLFDVMYAMLCCNVGHFLYVYRVDLLDTNL